MVPVEAVSYQPTRGRVFAALSLRGPNKTPCWRRSAYIPYAFVGCLGHGLARSRLGLLGPLRHLQGALDRFGVTSDYAEKRTGRLIRLIAPLFPVSHRRQRELKRSGEFALS